MQQQSVGRWVIVLVVLTFGMVQTLRAEPVGKEWTIPIHDHLSTDQEFRPGHTPMIRISSYGLAAALAVIANA